MVTSSASYFVIIVIRWNTDIGHHWNTRQRSMPILPVFSTSGWRQILHVTHLWEEFNSCLRIMLYLVYNRSKFSGVTIAIFPTIWWDRDNFFVIIPGACFNTSIYTWVNLAISTPAPGAIIQARRLSLDLKMLNYSKLTIDLINMFQEHKRYNVPAISLG